MITLTLADICIIMMTIISAVIGLIRGMTKEFITVLTWVLAIILAIKYGAVVGAIFESITTEMVKKVIGGTLIFISVLIIGSIVNVLINKVIKFSGFIFLDKFLGAGFGVLRSLLILLLIIPLTNDIFANAKWWQESILINKLQTMAITIKDKIPKNWNEHYTKVINELKL